MLISIFSVNLGWFDSIGYVPASESITGWFKTMFLPSLSIAFGSSAVLARYIRVSIANQQKQDYVWTAKSKGLSEKIIMNKHILRNSLKMCIRDSWSADHRVLCHLTDSRSADTKQQHKMPDKDIKIVSQDLSFFYKLHTI